MAAANFIDYYAMFDLDRTMTEKELKRALGKASNHVTMLEGSTDPSDTKTRQELRESKEIILEAMRILGKPDSRREYDIQLDAAIKSGTVNREKPEEIRDILARARKYFEEHRFELALQSAREALEKHANSEEPHEIITRSLLMLGDYDEALESASKSAEAFQSSVSLWWLQIRIAVMMEMYDKAQTKLNEALARFGQSAQFQAEQAYLYFHAHKVDLGERMVEQYIQAHPNDSDYRRIMAYNLLEIANMYYKYDTNSDMLLITEESDYKDCLRLLTLANKYYQDDYLSKELEAIKQFGETELDEECRRMRNTYIVVAVLPILFNVFISSSFSMEVTLIVLAVAAWFGLSAFIVTKYGTRPYWQIYRDHYRGFKQHDESLLFSIVSYPYELISSLLGK